jgi:saccharopine dehydrogenase-like NADP-dependent oxidoreductase
MARISKVVVAGLGEVGEPVARLLTEAGFDVTACTIEKVDHPDLDVRHCDATDRSAFEPILAEADAVVSCLPFHRNLPVAEAAAATGCHYFDLTEDVEVSRRVGELAHEADVLFAPQCGLAPGFIAIAGASVASRFDRLRSIDLRVGALPRHPSGRLGYSFNWSPEGVVNEYLNDCEVIRHGKVTHIPAMREVEPVTIGGLAFEAFATSGGAGTMCRSYEGLVDRLDYKTLRYPGHCDLMRFFFDELRMRDRRDLAGEILVDAKPPVDDDVVYLYVAVEGWSAGSLLRNQLVRTFLPREIAGRRWRAIAWTTAASVCALVEMAAEGALPERGLLRQERVDYEAFVSTMHGAHLAVDDGR